MSDYYKDQNKNNVLHNDSHTGYKHLKKMFVHLLCIRVQTGNLGQLCLIFTHNMLDVVLGCMLDVCQLLENTGQDDVFWWHTVLQHQAHFSLQTKGCTS